MFTQGSALVAHAFSPTHRANVTQTQRRINLLRLIWFRGRFPDEIRKLKGFWERLWAGGEVAGSSYTRDLRPFLRHLPL